MLQTILNSRMRTPDGTILESKHRHDYVSHLDANGKHYFLDGGLDYVHCSANGDEYLLTIYPDYPHELIRLHVKWGTYGKEGDQPLKYVAIADLDPYHLRAILDTQQKTMRPEMYKVMQDEVNYRNAPPEMDDREVVNVISLDEYRPHLSGQALCLQCDNTWAAVAPIGTYEFQCPKCQTLKGVFIGLTAPEEAWECQCGNQHFYINRNGGLCARCGLSLNIEN